MLVGGGNGMLAIMVPPPPGGDARLLKSMPIHGATQVEGRVTSICLDMDSISGPNLLAYIGTDVCNIYQVAYDLRAMTITAQLVQSAHHSPINDVAFPTAYGEV